ncbi:MAG TPA: GcrA family cell cycle regulator [Steroidobacteraceae bacterium]
MTTGRGEWATDANVALAARLWNEGLSARLIGLAVGCSKGAVVGFARRSGLTARTSPIVRRVEEVTPPAPKVVPRVRRVAPPAPAPAAAPGFVPRVRRCQFIEGDDPRTWRMCNAATEGGAWCPQHRARVFAPTPQRRRVEEVAA